MLLGVKIGRFLAAALRDEFDRSLFCGLHYTQVVPGTMQLLYFRSIDACHVWIVAMAAKVAEVLVENSNDPHPRLHVML